jgi:5-carboxymethyl-2-hydroxymuconate isomerase
MPHLTLEYTANLRHRRPDAALLLGLHRVLESAPGVRIGNCKSRWREVEGWVVGDGRERSAFVHLDIRLLEGRPEAQRQAVGSAALELLKGHFLPAPDGVEIQITVEVLEIGKALYFKHPPGTLAAPAARRV